MNQRILFFSDIENEYKFLRTKSKQVVNSSKIPKMSFSLVLLKKLKEGKLRNTIEEFKDELKCLKIILNKIKKLKLLKEQEINETEKS